jgi:hypothetical protein
LVWIGTNTGATSAFQTFVRSFANNPKLYGFRLGDELDPTGKYKVATPPSALMAESDFIHANCPGAKTFTTLMDMGSYSAPSFKGTYNYANTHIDLFGLDPYPVRHLNNGQDVYDVNYIDRTVKAALDAGIELSRIVPVFQAFGAGTWTIYTDSQPGGYGFPTPTQMNEMFARWAKLVPNPEFDFAYIWEVKASHICIGGTSAPELALRELYRIHNTAPAVPTKPPPTPLGDKLRAYADQADAGTLKPKTVQALSATDGSLIILG